MRQKISWSRFEISKDGFQEILGKDRSYGPFIDLILSFGVKYNSRADDFTVFHSRGSDAESTRSSGKVASFIHGSKLIVRQNYATMFDTCIDTAEKTNILGLFDIPPYTTRKELTASRHDGFFFSRRAQFSPAWQRFLMTLIRIVQVT
jgi:hypothetical protein